MMNVEIIGGPRDGEVIPVANGRRHVAFPNPEESNKYTSMNGISPAGLNPIVLSIEAHPTRHDRACVRWPK